MSDRFIEFEQYGTITRLDLPQFHSIKIDGWGPRQDGTYTCEPWPQEKTMRWLKAQRLWMRSGLVTPKSPGKWHPGQMSPELRKQWAAHNIKSKVHRLICAVYRCPVGDQDIEISNCDFLGSGLLGYDEEGRIVAMRLKGAHGVHIHHFTMPIDSESI